MRNLDRHKALRTPFVVTSAVLLVACGGSTTETGQGGSGGSSSAGTGNSAGAGGTGAGGDGSGASAGTSVGGAAAFGGSGPIGGSGGSAGSAECPPEPPIGPACAGVAAGTQCAYGVDCESGLQKFTYTCDAQGTWSLDARDCSLPWDSCQPVDVQCRNGAWTWQDPNAGSNPPPPCPAERPEAGSTCTEVIDFGAAPTCGYYCDDGQTWTVAGCTYADALWELDGACDNL